MSSLLARLIAIFRPKAHASLRGRMRISEAEATLRKIVQEHLGEGGITPQIALAAMLQFHSRHKLRLPITCHEDDMLLFQYGIHDWDGKGEKFDLDFTRQFIDPNDDEFYQVRLTLFYPKETFEGKGSCTRWSLAAPTLEDWKRQVSETVGFQLAGGNSPTHYEISLIHT